MKSIYLVAGLAAALWALPAVANEPEKSESQHERFAHCAHESKGLRGEEHQKFMHDCLKGNKSGEMSVSNALTALTKGDQVTRRDRKYHAA